MSKSRNALTILGWTAASTIGGFILPHAMAAYATNDHQVSEINKDVAACANDLPIKPASAEAVPTACAQYQEQFPSKTIIDNNGRNTKPITIYSLPSSNQFTARNRVTVEQTRSAGEAITAYDERFTLAGAAIGLVMGAGIALGSSGRRPVTA